MAIEGLSVAAWDGTPVLRAVSLSVAAGEAVALVGESGSGKSVSALAALGRLPPGLRRTGGRVSLLGDDPDALDRGVLRDRLARRVGFVPQDPLAAFDPLFTVGDQITERGRLLRGGSALEALGGLRGSRGGAALHRAAPLVDAVGIPEAERRAGDHPHAFSGGMRQRTLIAEASAEAPALLIADEPTTALDAALERQILDLILAKVRDAQAGLLLISHDLNLVAWYADRCYVLQGGRVVEAGPTERLFRRPSQPYTRALLTASPAARAAAEGARSATPALRREPLVRARHLMRRYGRGSGATLALDDVSIEVGAGEFLALIGASESGKSTLGRMMLALEQPDEGEVCFDGQRLAALPPRALQRLRRRFQPIFQDPMSSLDPRWSVGRSVAQPLCLQGLCGWPDLGTAVATLLGEVGLPGMERRYPHELSGGQRQRVAIARALAPRPDLVVADEALSALDVTTQDAILALLDRFRAERGAAVVFISHDLRLVRRVADRVAVMHAGRVVETGPPDRLFSSASDPHTRRLVESLLPLRYPLDAPRSGPLPQERMSS